MSQSFCYSYAKCYANCYYNFNLCGIFEKMTSFSPILNPDLEQGKLMAAVNVQKNMSYTVRSSLKFGEIF